MTKDSVADWSTTPSDNSDIAGINILGTGFVSGFDGALRTLMAQAKAGFQAYGTFDSEAQFAATFISTILASIQTTGYYSGGDGGGHVKKRISTPSPVEAWHKQSADGAWWEVTADEPNHRMFGAIIDDTADDTTALQNAVNYAQAKEKPLKLCTGTTLVTDTITVADSFGFKMYGATWQVSSEVRYGAKIRTTSDNPILDVAPAQFSIEGVAFEGTDSATSKGVYIHRATNADDMDSNISRCTFGDFNQAIIQEGRGLWLFATNFVNCDEPMAHSWPSSGTSFTDPIQELPQGFRSNRIVNCRAHSCGVFVNTTGADSQYYRGLVMIGNLMDVGDALFKGGLIQGVIANNVCEFTGVMPYAIEIERGGHGCLIVDNILNAGANDGSASSAALSAIRVYSTASLTESSISRNKAEQWYRDGIVVECAATNCTFDGNIIKNVGISGDPVYACLRFVSVALTNCTIIGGVLHSTVATAKNLSFQGAGTTLTNCYIGFVAHDTTKDLIGTTFTDGGGNTIIRGNGTIGTTEAGFFGVGTISPLNPLHVVDTGSSPVRIQRSGSAGGVGIVFQNTSGSITVFGTPSAANDGAFTPGTDNTITLGSASLRWEQLFAGTTTISTSDEREKENVELVRETVLDAWGDVQWCTFRFKGRTRLHVGLIAQRVEAAFEAHGLDPFELGILCYDEWDAQEAEYEVVDRYEDREAEDGTVETVTIKERQETRPAIAAGNRYGIRYEEALALEAAYVRRRLDRMEAKTTVH